MLNSIETRIFMQDAPRRVKHLSPLDYSQATGLARRVLDRMARDFQVVTPMTVHLSSPELLAAVWALGRETLAAGPLERSRREAVAAAVSTINTCSFCVDVHTATLHATGNHSLADQLRKKGAADTPDVLWAKETLHPHAPILAAPPFAPREAAQLMGTAITFHYINRIVNVFLHDSPLPLPKFMRGVGGRIFGGTIGRRMVSSEVQPGQFLTELPVEPLPAAFGWAESNPDVAGALARWSSAAEAAGTRSVPAQAQRAVTAFVDGWSGEEMPLGRQWLDRGMAGLEGPAVPIGRLALLAAVASHRVDDEAAAAVLDVSGERGLVEVVAWGAYCSARRIASWFHAPAEPSAQ